MYARGYRVSTFVITPLNLHKSDVMGIKLKDLFLWQNAIKTFMHINFILSKKAKKFVTCLVLQFPHNLSYFITISKST